MRIIHAVCTSEFGGVERHIALLAAMEHDRGHDVVVLGGDPGIMRRTIDRAGVEHRPVSGVGEVAIALSQFRDADVFNVHMTAAEVAAAFAFPARHVPVVATRHFAARRGRSSRAASVVARRAAARISAQIAVSCYVAEQVEPPTVVVVTGVVARPDAVTSGQRAPRVLVAQRLESEKGTEDAVQIFAASRLAEHGWGLDIAGIGSQRSSLERLVVRLDLGASVRFLGHRDDVAALMDQASLLIGPGQQEALGLTVLEAMAHGLPAIAARVGGHLETLGAVLPELCYPADALDAAGELLRTLADDPVRRDVVGRHLQRAQRRDFSLLAQAAATEAVYRSVL